jgi:hypothetical protein
VRSQKKAEDIKFRIGRAGGPTGEELGIFEFCKQWPVLGLREQRQQNVCVALAVA